MYAERVTNFEAHIYVSGSIRLFDCSTKEAKAKGFLRQDDTDCKKRQDGPRQQDGMSYFLIDVLISGSPDLRTICRHSYSF
jgi:hypothetical protein